MCTKQKYPGIQWETDILLLQHIMWQCQRHQESHEIILQPNSSLRGTNWHRLIWFGESKVRQNHCWPIRSNKELFGCGDYVRCTCPGFTLRRLVHPKQDKNSYHLDSITWSLREHSSGYPKTRDCEPYIQKICRHTQTHTSPKYGHMHTRH